MTLLKKFKWTIVLTLLAPLLLFATFFLTGGEGGGGSLVPFLVIFPWSGLSKFGSFFEWLPFIEFSVYGFIIDLSSKKNTAKLTIVITHIILAIIVVSLGHAE